MKTGLVLGGGLLLLLGIALLGVRYGSTEMSWSAVAGVFFGDGSITGQERTIIWYIRVPRVLTGILVGAGLSISGVLLQGLFRNPMASPGVIGVSAGGALGATSALALGLGALTVWAVPVAAFCGALTAAFTVYALASRQGRTPIATLILCGMAVTAIGGALTSLILSLSVADWEIARQILFWLMGGLTDRTWQHVEMCAPLILLCSGASLFTWRELNLFLGGEESAAALGVDTVRAKRWILTLAAGAAGAAVAVSGVIGFVGLIVPHICRLVVGPDHRRLIPLAAIGGAAFLVGMDLAARAVLGREEIRLGIVTSGLGGPFFLYLILRFRKRAEVF